MKGGFSFCGVDIAEIGLEYAPENKDTYVYAPAETNINEETFEGHDGGYSYGTYKEPKTFTLRCFYENKHIAKGLMAKVFDLFRPGKKGLLVFKRRPWIYYYCTVTAKPDITEMYSYLNGLVTITMKAYYPLGRAINITNDSTEEDAYKHLFYNKLTDPFHNEIMNNTGMLDKEEAVPNTSFTGPITTATLSNYSPILLYNPGTERANVGIVISGTADQGIIIANKTTGQNCRYVGFVPSVGDVKTDGISGKTVSSNSGIEQLAFLYHDYGFIELEPAFPIVRNLFVSYTANSSEVSAINILYQNNEEKEWYKDKYIFINTTWYKILRCKDKNTFELYKRVSSTGKEKTCVVLMNEIELQLSQNSNISKLSFTYKPTYA